MFCSQEITGVCILTGGFENETVRSKGSLRCNSG